VHLTYFTAVVDKKGKVATFADVYGLDARMASALFGNPTKFQAPTVEANDQEGRRMSSWRAVKHTGGLNDAISGLVQWPTDCHLAAISPGYPSAFTSPLAARRGHRFVSGDKEPPSHLHLAESDPRVSPILKPGDRSGGQARFAGQIPHPPAKRRPRHAYLQPRDHAFPRETKSS
jgi:hypothetical protein